MSLFKIGCLVKTRRAYTGELCGLNGPGRDHLGYWTSIHMTPDMIGLYLRKETIQRTPGSKPVAYDVLLLDEKIVYLEHGRLILAKTLRENEKPKRNPK